MNEFFRQLLPNNGDYINGITTENRLFRGIEPHICGGGHTRHFSGYGKVAD